MERSRLSELKKLERSLRCKFKNKELLNRTLTHSSYAASSLNVEKNIAANEELEFLGDAVLGLIVADYFYRHYPEGGEGKLSKLRAKIVNKNVLFPKAVSLNLADFVRVSSAEDKSGGRQRPGLLADMLEALIGALYVDNGFRSVRKFVLTLFKEELTEVDSLSYFYDFKSQFQEYAQARFKTIPRYQVISTEGPDHKKIFSVSVMINGQSYGRGSGLSKKEAEQQAAQSALKKLESRRQ